MTIAQVEKIVISEHLACIRNWRTTIVGVLMIAAGFAELMGLTKTSASPETLIMGGVGLLLAKDAAK